MKTTIVVLFAMLAIANCWGFHFSSIKHAFDKVGNDIKHVATNAGNDIKHVATNAGDQIKNEADKVGNDIDAQFKQFGQHVAKLADQDAQIAASVADRLKNVGEAVETEAEKIYQKLKVPLECAKAIAVNSQLFFRFYEISQDPSKIVLEWNPMADELYDICVTCSGGESSKFAWIKEIEIKGEDIDVAMCIADIVDLSIAGVEMANVEDDIDPEVILDFINSLIDMTQDCPSAISYIKSKL